MQITLKTIVKAFESFSKEHLEINSFNWGELFNISTKDTLYPNLHILPIQSKKIGSLNKMSFEIYIMDLQKQDDLNLLDIMNNTFLIANDIISQFYEYSDINDFTVDETNVNFYPFTGDFDDVLAGWKVTLDVETIQTNNKCNIPK